MADDPNEQRLPFLQRLMENPWLLLALGILVPTLSYTVWGTIDLFSIPEATLP